MSTNITCWLNTSPTKQSVWLKPIGSGLVKGNIFVNGLASGDRDVIVGLLRKCFGRGVSVVVDLPIEGIVADKSGALGTTALTATAIVDLIESAMDRPTPVADPALVERASAIADRLAGLPARAPRPSVEADDDDGDPFGV